MTKLTHTAAMCVLLAGCNSKPTITPMQIPEGIRLGETTLVLGRKRYESLERFLVEFGPQAAGADLGAIVMPCPEVWISYMAMPQEDGDYQPMCRKLHSSSADGFPLGDLLFQINEATFDDLRLAAHVYLGGYLGRIDWKTLRELGRPPLEDVPEPVLMLNLGS